MTHDVSLSVCHNFPYRAGYFSTSAYALVNCISQANIKLLFVCSIGLYTYTNTAYRPTDKVNKVDKGSEGGWRRGVGVAKGVAKGVAIISFLNLVIIFFVFRCAGASLKLFPNSISVVTYEAPWYRIAMCSEVGIYKR